MPKSRPFSSQPIVRSSVPTTNTTRSSAPVHARSNTKKTGDAVFNAMITAVRGISRFQPDVERGYSFTARFFCESLHPELNIDISENYNLPYDMDEKRFHCLVFEYMPTIKDTQPDSYDDVVNRLFNDLRELNPKLYTLPASTLSMTLKIEDVLFGIASKNNLDDIEYYVTRKDSNNPYSETLLHQSLKNIFPYLGFIPSDKTCQKILTAKNQYDEVQHSAVATQHFIAQQRFNPK